MASTEPTDEVARSYYLAWPSRLGIHPQKTVSIKRTLEIALPAHPDSPRVVPETPQIFIDPGGCLAQVSSHATKSQ